MMLRAVLASDSNPESACQAKLDRKSQDWIKVLVWIPARHQTPTLVHRQRKTTIPDAKTCNVKQSSALKIVIQRQLRSQDRGRDTKLNLSMMAASNMHGAVSMWVFLVLATII